MSLIQTREFLKLENIYSSSLINTKTSSYPILLSCLTVISEFRRKSSSHFSPEEQENVINQEKHSTTMTLIHYL